MKRDVTMWGRRTKRGAVDDGLTFAKRYVINNYRDERKLRGLQLLLGELPCYDYCSDVANSNKTMSSS